MLAAEIAQYLHNAGVVIFDPVGIAGNIFMDFMPSAPDECVMVEVIGGAQASSKLGYDSASPHFIIRGTRDPRRASDLAQRIYGAMQGLRSLTLPGGTYLVLCVASTPGHMGVDGNGRHEYTLNVECEIRNQTTHRE